MKNKPALWSIAALVGALALAVSTLILRQQQASPPPAAPPLAGDMEKFVPVGAREPGPTEPFLDPYDRQISLAAFKGKLTLVNFWATWCAPCVKELPTLAKLKSLRDDDAFTVVTINEDHGGREAVGKFAATHAMGDLPENIDPEMVLASAIPVRGLPTTLLLDPDGRILGRFEGDADWSSPDALRLIDWYVARTKPKSGP
jgi:thiol-disulfide isomerase/thioredoxin